MLWIPLNSLKLPHHRLAFLIRDIVLMYLNLAKLGIVELRTRLLIDMREVEKGQVRIITITRYGTNKYFRVAIFIIELMN